MTSGAGHPRRWAILGVLVVSLLVVVLDNTVLNIALPTIQSDLHASQSQLVWAVDSYILVFAALLFTWGVLGDRSDASGSSHRPDVFALASAVCAFAPTPRCSSASAPSWASAAPRCSRSRSRSSPSSSRRTSAGKAIGAWAGAVGAAVALGPVLGGLLLQNPEWSPG